MKKPIMTYLTEPELHKFINQVTSGKFNKTLVNKRLAERALNQLIDLRMKEEMRKSGNNDG